LREGDNQRLFFLIAMLFAQQKHAASRKPIKLIGLREADLIFQTSDSLLQSGLALNTDTSCIREVSSCPQCKDALS
jgi:hypothetical protein